MKHRYLATLIGIGTLFHATVSLAQSSSVFSASGDPIDRSSDAAKASVGFSLSGTALTITVTNNGTTSSNASILESVYFNTDTAAEVDLLPAAIATQSLDDTPKNPSLHSNVDYTGAWQMRSNVTPPGEQQQYSYGLGAAAEGKLFPANAFDLGKGGGDDYGVIGSATDLHSTTANKVPLAFGSIVFTIKNFLGTVITSVRLAYGSDPQHSIETTLTSGTGKLVASSTGGSSSGDGGSTPVTVPEPASVAMLLSGIGGIRLLRRRCHARTRSALAG